MPTPSWDAETFGYDTFVYQSDRNAWDVVYLGGMMLPGLAEVMDGACERKLDIKNAKGMDGATITPNGYEPAKIVVKLTLVPAEWVHFQQVLPLIQPKLGKATSPPMLLEHPATSGYGIDKVLVQKVGLPRKANVTGTKEVTIHLVQWLPQPKKAAKLGPSKGTDVATVKDAVEAGEPASPYRPGKAPGEFVFDASKKPLPPSAYNAVPNPK